MKYLLALLNSKLLNRQYQKINPEIGRVFAQVKIDYVSELPIIISDKTTLDKFVLLVDKILILKSEGKSTTDLEQQIDNLVYRLYELSYDEVKVIDPEFGLSREEYEAIELEA